MVICKYFQQGYCRYGQNCRFEHTRASKYSYIAPQLTNTSQNVGFSNSTTGNSNASSIFRSAVQNQSVFGQNPTNRISVFNRLGSQPNAMVSNDNQRAKSIFAQANTNLFSQVQNQNVASVPQRSKAANLFANAASAFNAPSAFNTPSFSSSTGNVFQIAERHDQSLCDDNFYSQLEELSKSDIEAFECAEFRLGCIPEIPPPKSLCV